ncbi:hypothetical protein COY62_00070 [bacterium (Candidatus Howlettbacteria) CG_4_10_14_0_8_um_filter_40_9]|nr:MAG: hypothetical protein COY62_00070 [bacterium (Candidatus Howlettbacteria) CG_4_10_14_0_8_um_filter_40_9]
MNFEITTLPHKETLGDNLKKARETKGFDVRYVEEAIKIRAKYLLALENGDYKKLPPDVYIKGFLKNYAIFLGIETERVMRLYAKERGLEENVKKAVEKRAGKADFRSPRVIVTPKTLVIGLIATVVLSIVLYIGWQVRILTSPPKLTVFSPTDNSSIEADTIYVEGKADPGADILINDVLIGGGPDGDFKEKISLQNGTNTIVVVARNRMNKETKEVRNIAVNLAPVLVAANVASGVELKVNSGPNSAWIHVEIDGVPVEKDGIVMLSGSSRVFKGTNKVVITTKNAGSTNVTFNGKDIGPLGKEGETVKNREFTKDMQVR